MGRGKRLYYSAYDTQTGRYMASGRNSRTRQQCVKAIAHYLNSGDDFEEPIPATEEEVCMYDFIIEEHQGKLNIED